MSHPVLPEGLEEPAEITRDGQGRIWQKGGVPLEQVFERLLQDRLSARDCFRARRERFATVRRSHNTLYRSMLDDDPVPLEVVLTCIADGMTALYSSILYGLLDEIAYTALHRRLVESCGEVGTGARLATLMKSACAAAALAEGAAVIAGFYEFGSVGSGADLERTLSPLDVSTPSLSDIEERVDLAIRQWPASRERRLLQKDGWPASLLALLYEFGQENFFVGARFRGLVGMLLHERSGRADYLDVSFKELAEVMK